MERKIALIKEDEDFNALIVKLILWNTSSLNVKTRHDLEKFAVEFEVEYLKSVNRLPKNILTGFTLKRFVTNRRGVKDPLRGILVSGKTFWDHYDLPSAFPYNKQEQVDQLNQTRLEIFKSLNAENYYRPIVVQFKKKNVSKSKSKSHLTILIFERSAKMSGELASDQVMITLTSSWNSSFRTSQYSWVSIEKIMESFKS